MARARQSGLYTSRVSVGFVAGNMAPGQVFLQVLLSYPVSAIHSINAPY
jgi:hypothetical protein